MDKFVHFQTNAGNGCANVVKLNIKFIESISRLPNNRAEIIMASGQRLESFDDYFEVINWLTGEEIGLYIEE